MILLYDKIDGYYWADKDTGQWGIHRDGKIFNSPTEATLALLRGEIEWSDE